MVARRRHHPHGELVTGEHGRSVGRRGRGTGPRSPFQGDELERVEIVEQRLRRHRVEPGKRFGFDVKVKGLKVAGWTYEFEPLDGGCRVVETWVDRRGGFVKGLSPLATGTKDRAARNRETMDKTLERLAAAAEKA